MKEYRVDWWSDKIEACQHIEASSENEAYKIAIDKFTYEECPRILISTGWWGFREVSFVNPHYTLKETRSEQPARPDGSLQSSVVKESHSQQHQSSGWATFHNVCGWVGIAIIFIGLYRIYGLYARVRNNPDEKFTGNEFELMWQNTFGLIELGIIVTIANFFMAFCVNVITEIRHNTRLAVEYQKRTVNVLENWGK